MTTSGTDLAPLRRALKKAAPGLARDLPWINHSDPWAVFVSEVMLQQTSVGRVEEKWRLFLRLFPTPSALAAAPLAEVLRAWQGLGYPRRAKNLRAAAQAMVERHDGRVPSTVDELRELPGVGEYTAAAVASFAFGVRVGVLDTNVGRVLARAAANRSLTRPEAREMVARLLPRDGVAAFNQTLLDLGATRCTTTPRCEMCPVSSVCRWHQEGGPDPAPSSAAVSRRQAPFAGSDRQLRGRVMASVRDGGRSEVALTRDLHTEAQRLKNILAGLERDGLIEKVGRSWRLAGD